MTTRLTKTEISSIAARAFADPVYFGKTFLPQWFSKEVQPIHYGLVAILTRKCGFLEDYPFLPWIIENFQRITDPNDPQSPTTPIFFYHEGRLAMRLGRNTLVLIPRGFSKTTWLNTVNLHNIAYQERRFPLYVSKTGPHAVKQLMSVARQLSNNRLFIEVFGDLRPKQRELGLRWSESEGFIQTTTGATLVAVGRGAQIRGMLDDGKRPDVVNFDDLEDQESTKTDMRRADTRDWFFSDALGVLPELDVSATANMLANMTHPDCLAARLMADPEWTTIKFGVLDKHGVPLWPEMMDLEKIERRKRSWALQNKLGRFYMEYFNEIRATEDAKFRPEMIKIEFVPTARIKQFAIAIDPAISDSVDADSCTITVLGIRDDGVIQILDQWGKVGAPPKEQVDTYFALALKWKLQSPRDKFGVESIAYQAALTHLLREEMFRRKFYFEITPITHSKKKTERIEGILQPRYASGYIVHQRHFPNLEMEMLDWPHGKDDYLDSTAMGVALLDDSAHLASGKDWTKDQYQPLEELFGGEWRSY